MLSEILCRAHLRFQAGKSRLLVAEQAAENGQSKFRSTHSRLICSL